MRIVSFFGVGLLATALCCGSWSAHAQLPPAPAPSGSPTSNGVTAFVDFETRFSSWSGSRGVNVYDPAPGKGSQLYTPVTLGVDKESEDFRFQTRVKSGYVYSNNATPGQQTSLSTLVDTQVTATLTYLGSESLRSFVGVATNLPTGQTYLPGNLRFNRMDPDLVDIGSYGAGLNINPTTGIIFALTENTAVSLGVGYAWQGSFKKEGFDPGSVALCGLIVCGPAGAAAPLPTFNGRRDIDPGDVTTVNANTSSLFGDLSWKNSLSFSTETTLKQDGLAIGRKGASLAINSALTYKFDPRASLLLNVSWKFSEKDKIVAIPGFLIDEPKNRNSNVLIGSVEPVFAVTERLNLGLNYSILWRMHNYYDFTEDQFVPEKLKHSVGSSLSYAVAPGASIGIRGSYFWIREGDGPFLPTIVDNPGTPLQRFRNFEFQPPSLRYAGFTAVLSGKVAF